jgi:hypothetical protein
LKSYQQFSNLFRVGKPIVTNSSEMQFIELAATLNSQYHDGLRQKQCHFRGGLGGVSLVSLSDKTPELGLPGVSARNASEKIAEIDNLSSPRRATPEKELQAWIINQLLFGKPPDFWKKLNLTFVTSELRIEQDGGNVVNDILALDVSGALWVIELKSARKLDELIKQCIAFSRAIEGHKELFKRITTLLVQRISWDGNTVKRMIIWPASSGIQRDKTLQMIKDHNIVAVAYANKYTFEFESE